MYAYIENNQVTRTGSLPLTWRWPAGSTTSNFHLLGAGKIKEAGWLPLTDVTPAYNEATHMKDKPTYTIGKDSVTVEYTVVERPPVEPTEFELLQEEVLRLRRETDNVADVLVAKEVITEEEKQALSEEAEEEVKEPDEPIDK